MATPLNNTRKHVYKTTGPHNEQWINRTPWYPFTTDTTFLVTTPACSTISQQTQIRLCLRDDACPQVPAWLPQYFTEVRVKPCNCKPHTSYQPGPLDTIFVPFWGGGHSCWLNPLMSWNALMESMSYFLVSYLSNHSDNYYFLIDMHIEGTLRVQTK